MHEQSRSKELLKKVYDHLDNIDVTKLSMSEMKDFLEVVQKGQFLESTIQMPHYGWGGMSCGVYSSLAGKDGNVE